jgi:hypothetical protein
LKGKALPPIRVPNIWNSSSPLLLRRVKKRLRVTYKYSKGKGRRYNGKSTNLAHYVVERYELYILLS